MAQPRSDKTTSDLSLRLLSAAVMIPPAIAAVYFGFPYFDILVLIGGAILIFELYGASGKRLSWTAGGAIYVALAVVALLEIRRAETSGALSIFWIFLLVWSADSCAYFFGRVLGGPKLAPKLSPKKTWAGFIGALIGAAIIGGALAIYLEKSTFWTLILTSSVLGAVSQGGDLLESWFKRRFHRKDMSGLIPGHGGLFDRVDGLLPVAIVCWCGEMLVDEVLLEWL